VGLWYWVVMPDDRVPVSLYEQDLDAWAISQAAALRAAGQAAASGDGQAADLLQSLDWDNLAEEIEGLARKDRRDLGSRVALIIEHLAKLEFSPSVGPRAGWSETVLRERRQIELILRDSPSLRRLMPDFLADEIDAAIRVALHSLEVYAETAAAGKLRGSRAGTGYRLDEVFGDWLPDVPAQ
jgi:hypothetical protein